MSGRARQEQPEQQGGGNLPPGMGPIVFDGFETMNTLAARPSIEDEECSWMDSFMPVGKSTARTMPGIGASIFNIPGTNPIVFFGFANVADVPYCFVVLTNGDLWALATQSGVATLIAPAVVTAASQLNIGISQWGNQYVIFVCGS